MGRFVHILSSSIKMNDTFYIIAIIIGFLLTMNLIQSAEINKLKKEKDKLYKEVSRMCHSLGYKKLTKEEIKKIK